MDNNLTRQTAHVILDMLSAQQIEDDSAKEAAAKTAFQRLNDIGAVNLLVDEESGTRTLDLSAMLYGSTTLTWSLMQLLELKGDPIDNQIIALRAHVNRVYGDGSGPDEDSR